LFTVSEAETLIGRSKAGIGFLPQNREAFKGRTIRFASFTALWLIKSCMVSKTTPARRADPVVQFSVFTANRLGRLHDLISLLGSHSVHVLAMTVLDTTDSTIIRLVVDDPEKARDLMHENDFPFTESKVLVVEVDAATEL